MYLYVLAVTKIEVCFEIWASIQGHTALKISASQIYSELCENHETSTASKQSVFRWAKYLKKAKLM